MKRAQKALARRGAVELVPRRGPDVGPDRESLAERLPLEYLNEASRAGINAVLMNKLAASANKQKQMRELLAEALDDQVAAELCRLILGGTLQRVPVPRKRVNEREEKARALLRLTVKEMEESEEGAVAPFFDLAPVTAEFVRRHPGRRKRWPKYFRRYGCHKCGTKDKPHFSTGHCFPCYNSTVQKLKKAELEAV